MEGAELVKDLAKIESELAERLDQTRQSANEMMRKAEEEKVRIIAEVEKKIEQEEQASRDRIAEEGRRIIEEGKARAEADAGNIHEQAAPRIERAVEFILSQVLP